jgi:hypothetical protein
MENWGIHKVNHQLLLNPLPLRWALSYVCSFVSPSKHRYINHKSIVCPILLIINHLSPCLWVKSPCASHFSIFCQEDIYPKPGPWPIPMAWRPPNHLGVGCWRRRPWGPAPTRRAGNAFLGSAARSPERNPRSGAKWLVSGLSHQGIYICLYVFIYLFIYIYIHTIVWYFIYMHIWIRYKSSYNYGYLASG